MRLGSAAIDRPLVTEGPVVVSHYTRRGHGRRRVSYETRFPVGPILVRLGWAHIDAAGIVLVHHGANLSLARFACHSGQTIDRWFIHGLTSLEADRIATRLGCHGSALWGSAWYDPAAHEEIVTSA